MEGLQVKKGKARPTCLIHLEESINRHKLHIIKLELILRLLDNDEMSLEEVTDVRDLVKDYVERNQDVDNTYQTLPLDKIEALENLEAILNVAPSIVVKEKAIQNKKEARRFLPIWNAIVNSLREEELLNKM